MGRTQPAMRPMNRRVGLRELGLHLLRLLTAGFDARLGQVLHVRLVHSFDFLGRGAAGLLEVASRNRVDDDAASGRVALRELLGPRGLIPVLDDLSGSFQRPLRQQTSAGLADSLVDVEGVARIAVLIGLVAAGERKLLEIRESRDFLGLVVAGRQREPGRGIAAIDQRVDETLDVRVFGFGRRLDFFAVFDGHVILPLKAGLMDEDGQVIAGVDESDLLTAVSIDAVGDAGQLRRVLHEGEDVSVLELDNAELHAKLSICEVCFHLFVCFVFCLFEQAAILHAAAIARLCPCCGQNLVMTPALPLMAEGTRLSRVQARQQRPQDGHSRGTRVR
jgi:hypothetical protein